jgi:hypothetical protein
MDTGQDLETFSGANISGYGANISGYSAGSDRLPELDWSDMAFTAENSTVAATPSTPGSYRHSNTVTHLCHPKLS